PSRLRRRIPIGSQDVASVLDHALERMPDAEALVGRHARFSYRALDAEVNAAAAALQALGIVEGSRIAACAANHTDIVIAFLAAMRLGAIWVGINTALVPGEKAFMLRDSEATVLLATPDIAASLTAETTPLRTVVTVDPASGSGTWPDLVAQHHDVAPPRRDIDPHAPAAIAYTSGTTGFPKGAVHSQHNMLWPGAEARENDPAPPDERHGVMLPLTLLNLQILGPLFAFLKGTTCVCIDRADPIGLSAWIKTERITRMTAVPTVLHDLLTHPDVDPGDLATLRRPECGGTATPHAFRELFRSRFGADVLTGYGLTEAPTAVTREMPGDELVAGCSGRPFAPVEIVIVDDAGGAVPASELGEVCIRARRDGPWAGVYTPFLGYWRNGDATRHALQGGLLHTDDLGFLDGDGRLFVKDRRTDVVLRGGANVYPAEVERVLHEHPAVAAAAVLGVADARLGERVVAVVELRSGADAGSASLEAFCRDRLARYKVPSQWAFVDGFARTPMGKIRKAELRDLF
ncbi:MAG TPA: AMP-binding protein, partial [Acidimicrobiales bacterium]|nr:AMP-binding protein [Acidimicrobiales bacterium]